jgi:23S rRNA (uracil1939-C5)-methyltransferase
VSAALCRHFGTCGGCAYQDLDAEVYRALKRNLVVEALARHGFADAVVDETVEIGPATRRRATLKIAKRGGVVEIGFHAAESHTIVDMLECRVLTPSLVSLIPGLREMMASLLREGEKAELHVTQTEEGVDLALHWARTANTGLRSEIARWASKLKLARVTSGGEVLVEFAKPSVSFGKARVLLPPESFLQPTREGEAALQARVLSAVDGAKSVADLFAGCGTFSLPLAERSRVHAVDSDGEALAALAAAARGTQGLKPIATETRDLFKRPLTSAELDSFAAVVLDPPRAGAAAQIKALAASKVRRIAYVSCNPATFARDARFLVDGGCRMDAVVPVDQFVWSSHIELVATFRRD